MHKINQSLELDRDPIVSSHYEDIYIVQYPAKQRSRLPLHLCVQATGVNFSRLCTYGDGYMEQIVLLRLNLRGIGCLGPENRGLK